ncbi:hypothetical protein J6590_101208, partial [Homalodisca vitripennis]
MKKSVVPHDETNPGSGTNVRRQNVRYSMPRWTERHSHLSYSACLLSERCGASSWCNHPATNGSNLKR